MSEFFHQFGIDWRLLLSQAVNFFILLGVLRFFVYRPVLNILEERRKRIEDGLSKAAEADTRLEEAQAVYHEKLREAEHNALGVMREAEARAKKSEGSLLERARQKEDQLLKNAAMSIEGERQKAREDIHREGVEFIRQVIARTTELSPEKIDEALVKKAIADMRTNAS